MAQEIDSWEEHDGVLLALYPFVDGTLPTKSTNDTSTRYRAQASKIPIGQDEPWVLVVAICGLYKNEHFSRGSVTSGFPGTCVMQPESLHPFLKFLRSPFWAWVTWPKRSRSFLKPTIWKAVQLSTKKVPLRKGIVQISDHTIHLDSGDDLHRGLSNPGVVVVGCFSTGRARVRSGRKFKIASGVNLGSLRA